jgi:hypothetical protein
MAEQSSVVLIGLAKLKRNSDWHYPKCWNWRQRLCFVNNGVQAAIQVTEPAAMLPVKLRLPPGWRAIEACDRRSLNYSLVVGNEPGPPGIERLNLLFRDDALISAAYNLEPVLGALESDLDLQIAALAAPHLLFLHAGVVGWRGRAIVIVGRPQSGTSTLVAELVRAGASYYSDRYAILDREGRVCPFARPLWLSAAGGVHPVQYRAEELGAKVGTRRLRIGVVIVSKYLPRSRPRLAPITASAAAPDLMANTNCGKKYPEETLTGIRKALSGAWILKGIRGEARDIVSILMGVPPSELT